MVTTTRGIRLDEKVPGTAPIAIMRTRREQ